MYTSQVDESQEVHIFTNLLPLSICVAKQLSCYKSGCRAALEVRSFCILFQSAMHGHTIACSRPLGCAAFHVLLVLSSTHCEWQEEEKQKAAQSIGMLYAMACAGIAPWNKLQKLLTTCPSQSVVLAGHVSIQNAENGNPNGIAQAPSNWAWQHCYLILHKSINNSPGHELVLQLCTVGTRIH